MKARCVANDISKLPASVQARLRRSIHSQGPNNFLGIGVVYDVFGLQQMDGGWWLMLDTSPQAGCPYPQPAELFELVDAVVPAGWSVGFEPHDGGLLLECLGFQEWARDASFYERLLDDDPDARAVYQREKMKVQQRA